MADDVFTSIWNAAGSFDVAVERVREQAGEGPAVGGPDPASALRWGELRHHELRERTG